MASQLSTLPVEIVEIIASALDDNDSTDSCSLRLVCRELERKTLHHFGRTRLTAVRTDLSWTSLQKLRELSEHEHFGPRVETLLVQRASESNERGLEFWWNRHPQGDVIAGQPGAQLLRDLLLHKLTNCRSFQIHKFGYSESELESHCRMSSLMPTDAVGTLVAIIAETGLPTKSFHLDYRKEGFGWLDARRLNMEPLQRPAFRTTWAHLQELSLHLSPASDTFNWVLELIVRATGLRKLSLSCDHFPGSIGFLERVSSAVVMPGLQQLRLSVANVAATTLSRLLLRFRDSLRAVSFRKVRVQGQSDGIWISIFREMRRELPLLESFSVDHVRDFKNLKRSGDRIVFPALADNQVFAGSQGRRAQLTWREWRGEQRVFGVSHDGPGMDQFLELLARSAEYVFGPLR
ncbi:MAG: hypothetical protein M1837_001965 [Sclerophora amabilis]|nr:MAG: hypothetical protein M1837_001965 [Sclerophora amabilis]